MESQRDGVDVRAVVGDNGQGQNHEAELAKATERLKHGSNQAAVARGRIACRILVVVVVGCGGGHHGDTQEFGEQQWDDQANPSGEKDLAATPVRWLVDSVIGRIAGPSRCETVNGRPERQASTDLRRASLHRDINESAGVGEGAQNNDKHNTGRNPAPILVNVHNLVSGEGDEESAEGDNQDTGESRDIRVDRIKKLSAHDGIGSRPADACYDVEDRDWDAMLEVIRMEK